MIFDFQVFFQTFRDIGFIFSFLAPYKWAVLPVLAYFAFLIARDVLLFSSQAKWKREIEWDVFEIRVPREIEKGPKAMEQFFTSFWTLFNTPADWKQKYFDGEVTRWHSLEIYGSGGRAGFYMRVPKKFRHLVESMLYAEYPEIEIVDSPDYTLEVPNTFEKMEAVGLDLSGVELALKNPAPNPITTYVAFEEKGGEERIIDPVSMILETMSRLRPEEKAWVQMVVKPILPNWQKEGKKTIEEVKKEAAPKPGPAGTPVFSMRTPAEEEKLKMISHKISKQGFEVIVRTIYIAPKDIFDRSLLKNLTGYFNQYSSNLNYFQFAPGTYTGAYWYKWPFLFPGKRAKIKKDRLLNRYVQRYMPEATFSGRLADPDRPLLFDKRPSVSILNTEELATLFHPPTNVVLTSQSMERIESKKVGPPSYIPF